MDNYDVMQLEDNLMMAGAVGRLSGARSLTYKHVGSLYDLEVAMNGANAEKYILDVNVPRGGPNCSGQSETLVLEAVKCIREKCSNAIIIHSDDSVLSEADIERYGPIRHLSKDPAMIHQLFEI
jgi:hypothetical protein